MKILRYKEAGYEEAIMGMSLSYYYEGDDLEEWWKTAQTKASKVAKLLSKKEASHSKFLRAISCWITIRASRSWWQEMDQYKVATTSLSASTMHTLAKRPITQENFATPILGVYLDYLNRCKEEEDIQSFKEQLPEGYLQTRLMHCNYATLRTIIAQRHDHRLPNWQTFIKQVMNEVEHPELLESTK